MENFDQKFYVLRSYSYIKNVSKFLDKNFLTELKNSDGTIKSHITDLDNAVTYYGKSCIKCTIPTCFIEIEYKTSDGLYLIENDVFLYEENFPTLESLKSFQKATDYAFASQVTQEIKDIVEAFHNGYGCMCLDEV